MATKRSKGFKGFLLILIMFSLSISYAFSQNIEVITYEWPPYNYKENGKFVGISTEIVSTLLTKANIESHYRIYPWARGYNRALYEPNVAIYSMRRTPTREKLFKWVGPITPPSSSFMYKLKKRKDIVLHSLDDAKQYQIGVVDGDSMHQYLKHRGFETNTLQVVTRDTQNLKKLFEERIDLIIWTELTLPIKTKALGLPYHELEKVLRVWQDEEGYYLAFSQKTSDELVEQASIALTQIKEEGLLESVVEKYLNTFQ